MADKPIIDEQIPADDVTAILKLLSAHARDTPLHQIRRTQRGALCVFKRCREVGTFVVLRNRDGEWYFLGEGDWDEQSEDSETRHEAMKPATDNGMDAMHEKPAKLPRQIHERSTSLHIQYSDH
jgi:hypothetical protein